MASEVDIIERLREYFSQRKDIPFVFLFGSHVRGKTFRESDIDIAIYFKEGYSFESIKKIWRELEKILKKDLDIVVLNTASPLIGYAAIRGKAIAINDYRAYLDYMLSVSQEAEDFREVFTDMFRLREKLRAGVGQHDPIK
jgi:predicted nucleotidyltransferase